MAPRKTATVSSRKTAAKPAAKASNGGPVADFDRNEELK
ncbi:pyruvate dehydrogenase (acetyl-transferring) E1 component subunit alpha, partial [Rhizobium ruizarguesonis]